MQPHFSSSKRFIQHAKFCSGFCVVYAERICSRFPKSHLHGTAFSKCLSIVQWNTPANARVKGV